MKKLILTAALGILVFSCKKEGDAVVSGVDAKGEKVELSDLDMKASYAYGVSLGQNAERYNQNPQLEDSLDIDQVKKGIQDFLKDSKTLDSYGYGLNIGKQIKGALENNVIQGHLDTDEILVGMMDYLKKNNLKVSVDSVAMVMDEFYQTQLANSAAANKQKGLDFLAAKKKEEGVKTTESGLAYKVIKEGVGPKVKEGDKIKVKYKGTLIDGDVFDSTDLNNNGEPVEFTLQSGGLIPGWVEGMQLMSKGSKYEFYIPSELGYGDMGSGKIGPGDALIFEIELIDISEGTAANATPGQPGVNIETVRPDN